MAVDGSLICYQGIDPKIATDAYVAKGSIIVGSVEINNYASVWFNCVIRGDINNITIGCGTNIQDGTVIHVSGQEGQTIIGQDVVIGHMSLIHACKLHDGCMIGMGATVMDGAIVETGAWVGAGALISPGKLVKSGEAWLGKPAKPVREITNFELNEISRIVRDYKELARNYIDK